MVDIKTAFLEDDKEYYVLESIELDGSTYNLFSEVSDEKNVKVRKIVVENDIKYISEIDNDTEFKKVMLEFYKKMNS